jgi:hypothetical protein
VARFGVAADWAGEQAVLGLRGNIDLLSAPVLGAFFDAVITSEFVSVVLDLAEVSSIDGTLWARWSPARPAVSWPRAVG